MPPPPVWMPSGVEIQPLTVVDVCFLVVVVLRLEVVRPTVVEVTEARATMRLPCTKWLSSPATTVQGGVIAMLAEMTMLNAALSKAPAGTAIAGLDLKVNYLRPARPDGRDLVARASIIHSGRTIAVTSSEVENADGKLVALATGSAMYLPDRPANLGEVELGPTDGDQ